MMEFIINYIGNARTMPGGLQFDIGWTAQVIILWILWANRPKFLRRKVIVASPGT